MTFPAADILGSPGRNDHIKNATSPLRHSPPSAVTTTVPAFPSRRSQTLNKSPRLRKTSTTASVCGGGEGMATAKRSDTPTEFYIPVELYLSSRTSVGPRKVCSLSPPSPQTFHDRIRFSLGRSSLPPFLPSSPAFLSTPPHSPFVRKASMVASEASLDPLALRALPTTYNVFPDKSSWLSLSNRSNGCAQWRSATCKLTEEEDGCQLNVYIEVSPFCVFSELGWPVI